MSRSPEFFSLKGWRWFKSRGIEVEQGEAASKVWITRFVDAH